MKNNWNRAFFSLALGCLAIISAPSARAITVLNGALFDVSYDETQFSGGGFGLSGNVVSYFPDFPLSVVTAGSGSVSIDDFGRTFDIIAHPGVTFQSITMNVSGFYDNLPDSTSLTHTGSLTANGNASNVFPFVFSSFSSGAWGTSATVNLAATGNISANFSNSLSAFSSGFGDASVSIDNINFNVSAVPLPPAILSMLSGLFGMGMIARTRRRGH
jgi:hypothetical protein